MTMIKLMFVTAAMLAAPALAQEAAPPAAPALPFCSAKVTDSCQQTAAQQARAMTGEQADARDARNGGNWTPDGRVAKAKKADAPK
jgi:hypothetical protein